MAEQLLRDPSNLSSTPVLCDEHGYDDAIFAHPGYDHLEILLQLPSYRTPSGCGVHHQTALDACRIIANNRSGFLSRTRDRSGCVPAEDIVLTTPATYWYFLDDEASLAQYEVVNDFRAWRFPDTLPEHWEAVRPRRATVPGPLSDSAMSYPVKGADKCCIISGNGKRGSPSV